MTNQQAPQQQFLPPTPVKKKSKAPFILGGIGIVLIALMVAAVATKGFGLIDRILSMSNTTTDPLVGSWVIVAYEEDGVTTDVFDFEHTLGPGAAAFRDRQMMFFEDYTGFIYSRGVYEDIIWTSAGFGVYSIYDSNNEAIMVEIVQNQLYQDLNTAEFQGALVFQKHEVSLIHYD